MKQVVTARYHCSTQFRIPEGLDLEDKKQVKDWGIKWDTLYIELANGEELQIQAFYSAIESHDFKRPDETEVQEDEDEWDYMKSERDDECDEEYKKIVEQDKWCYDDMLLQLNHGQCFNDGRYESTTDADWELFTEAVKEDGYTETMYNRIKARLTERDG